MSCSFPLSSPAFLQRPTEGTARAESAANERNGVSHGLVPIKKKGEEREREGGGEGGEFQIVNVANGE